MIFSTDTNVIYEGLYGTIVFVCDNYVVIELATTKNQEPARLIVFREKQKDIKILKESTK